MTGRDYLVTIRWKADSLWSRATQLPCLSACSFPYQPMIGSFWDMLPVSSDKPQTFPLRLPQTDTLFVLGILSLSSCLAFHRVHLLLLLSTCALCQLGQRATNPECGLKAYRRGWAQRIEISLFNSDFRHDAHSKGKELGLFEKQRAF